MSQLQVQSFELGRSGYYQDGNEVPLDLGALMDEAEVEVKSDEIINQPFQTRFDIDWLVSKLASGLVFLLAILFLMSSSIGVSR